MGCVSALCFLALSVVCFPVSHFRHLNPAIGADLAPVPRGDELARPLAAGREEDFAALHAQGGPVGSGGEAEARAERKRESKEAMGDGRRSGE